MFFNKENIVMYFVHNKQMIVGIRKKNCTLFDRLIVNLDVYIWNEMAVKNRVQLDIAWIRPRERFHCWNK